MAVAKDANMNENKHKHTQTHTNTRAHAGCAVKGAARSMITGTITAGTAQYGIKAGAPTEAFQHTLGDSNAMRLAARSSGAEQTRVQGREG